MDNKKNLFRLIVSTLLLLAIVQYPNLVYTINCDAGWTYLITSCIFSLPVLGLIVLLPKKWIFCLGVSLLTILSIIDLSMIDLYKDYLLPGGILSTIKTNPQEAAEFYDTNLKEVLRWIPLILLCVASCICYKSYRNLRLKVIALLVLLVIPTCFISGKLLFSYNSELTLRYYLDHRVWNRTPYNVIFQSINTVKELKKRKMIDHAADVDFGAEQITKTSQKEVYILAVGESLRYDNVSLNGIYPRSTTPRLEALENLVLFHNYYSQACLTMYSVPQLVTRATPDNYDLNFMERSIIEPFRECGFKTFTIVSNANLLSYETYLSNGVDSLIVVPNVVENGEILSGDKTMASIVDSITQKYDKVFILMQFMGNHSFFTNYEKEFDVYKPNANSCTEAERQTSDSLLINAYNNSILYTDYILTSIIDVIDQPDWVSGFMFTSDHGEHISKDGAGHGGNCSPIKVEYHVPLIFWWSDSYETLYSDKVIQAKLHTQNKINGDNVFHSACDMADIVLDSIYSEPTWSIFSADFAEHERLILLPDGITTISVE